MITTRAMEKELHIDTSYEFYSGLCLAISSSMFIGSSFIIKKKALIKLTKSGRVRAGSGGYGYLREWLWWAGLLTMGIGEAANFAAYAFAPASLVTPLGALSVLVTAVLASKFLGEHLNILGKLGCLLCCLGSTIIVLNSPKENEIESFEKLMEKLEDSTFICYVIIVITGSSLIACYLLPKYGHTNVSLYIIICSAIGSLTVMSCKAVGLSLRDTLSGKSNDFANHWLPYLLIIITICCICIQMNYLNRALDIFDTSIVTPIYYVIFTTLVMFASNILFKEFSNMSTADIIGDLCGFGIVIVAIILLNAFQNININFEDLRIIMKPKRELLNLQKHYGDVRIKCDVDEDDDNTGSGGDNENDNDVLFQRSTKLSRDNFANSYGGTINVSRQL